MQSAVTPETELTMDDPKRGMPVTIITGFPGEWENNPPESYFIQSTWHQNRRAGE